MAVTGSGPSQLADVGTTDCETSVSTSFRITYGPGMNTCASKTIVRLKQITVKLQITCKTLAKLTDSEGSSTPRCVISPKNFRCHDLNKPTLCTFTEFKWNRKHTMSWGGGGEARFF